MQGKTRFPHGATHAATKFVVVQVIWITLLLGCGGANAASSSSGTSINPSYIDFGTQAVSTTKTGSVTISSTRKAQIQGVTLSGSSTFKITNWTGKTSIPAGGSVTLGVSFTPTSASNYTGVMSVTMNGSKFSVPLSGTGQTTSTPTPAPTVSVAVSPTAATVQASKSQQFSASVSGSTNTQVSWLVNGVAGGNSTVGTVTASGLYTAPATIPTGGSATVTAKSTADTSKSASADVTITAPTQTVSVSISPTSAILEASKSQQFTSSVSGTTNTGVTWLVNGVAGGNSTVGTITASGLYTSPATVPSGGKSTVTARSTADTAKSASADVTITSSPTTVSVSVSPTSATVAGGASQQFSASVSGTTNGGVSWSVNGVSGGNATYGTISSTGLYTAPACPSVSGVTVAATSVYDSSAQGNSKVTLGSATASSNTYYVTVDGNDSSDGSACRPFATIGRAAQAVSAGSVVHVAAGTYTGQVAISASGTASDRIQFICDVYRKCLVRGSNYSPSWGAAVFLLTGNYIDVVGFDVSDSGTSGAYGILGYGSVGNYRIVGNNVHNIGSNGSCNSNGFTGINTEGTGKGGGSYVAQNLVTAIGPSGCAQNNGIYFAGKGSTAVNNIVYGMLGGSAFDVAHNAQYVTIAFNTIDSSPFGIYTACDGNVVCDYNVFVNNIITNCSRALYEDNLSYMGSHNVYDHLLFYGNGGANQCYGSGNAGGTVSGGCTNTIVDDPLFVNRSTHDYHLQSTSPAIGAATVQSVPPIDYAGTTRSSPYDIGAYRY